MTIGKVYTTKDGKTYTRHRQSVQTWVSIEIYNRWDEQRKKESRNPRKPTSWSSWIREKVELGLNYEMKTPDLDIDEQLEIQNIHLQDEIDRLNQFIALLHQRKLIAHDRVLTLLDNKYKHFDNIVKELIDTEPSATLNTLMELAKEGLIETDRNLNRWRLRQ